jgi:hypothetical protein
MSVLNSDPWFGRGTTAFAGPAKYAGYEGAVASTDPRNGTSYIGSVKVFSDVDPRVTNTGVRLSNRVVTCIAMRNVSGAAILPGTVVKFQKADILNNFDGSAAAVTDAPLGVVDEYLPASGCANGDVCWVVVSGPTAITTAATLAAGALVTATAGAAATGTAANAIGVVLSAPANGKVRTLVNAGYGHSAA